LGGLDKNEPGLIKVVAGAVGVQNPCPAVVKRQNRHSVNVSTHLMAHPVPDLDLSREDFTNGVLRYGSDVQSAEPFIKPDEDATPAIGALVVDHAFNKDATPVHAFKVFGVHTGAPFMN